MSTKTTLKRIALVAVSALGFGLLSVMPAKAVTAVADHALDCNVAATVTSATACSTTAGANNFVQIEVGRDSGVDTAAATVVIVTGGTATSGSTAVSGSGTSTLVITGTADIVLTVPTPTAGVILVRSYATTSGVVSSTATTTVVVTVAAAGIAAGTINVGASTSFITDSSGVLSADATVAVTNAETNTGITADSTVAAPKAAAATVGTDTPVALIKVTLKDTQATPTAIAGSALTASISGAGLVAGTGSGHATLAGPAAGAATSTTDAAGIAVFGVYASGASGTGTITISRTSGATGVTTVIATETVSFYGPIAKITVLKGYDYIGSTGSATGTTSTDYVFRLTLEDSAGTRVADAVSITATSQDLTKVGAVTCGSTATATGRIYCSATGNVLAAGVAKVKFETGSALTPATAPYVSAESDIEVTQLKAAKFTVTGESSVNAGGIITYTITATDANGRPVPDWTPVLNYLFTSPTVSGGALVDNGSAADVDNFTLGGPNPVNELFDGVYFVGGKATDSVQAPFAKSTIKATFLNNGAGVAVSGGTYFVDAATRNQSVSVTTTVSDASSAAAEAANLAADAAAEAIDAANAATDAANLAAEAADAATVAAEEARDAADAATAAVEALATEVATLMAALKAQITTLANTVAKIAKKVKA